MRKPLPADGAVAAIKSKKVWKRPRVVGADVRQVTQGGINMMTDPLDITMMMS